MTVKQISIFIENKYGKLNEILSYLNDKSLRLISATVADTSDYGILRIITSNQQKTYELLKEKSVLVNLNDVIAIRIGNSVHDFAETISFFTKAGVEIEYMYSFSVNGSAILVLRTKNLTSAYEVIRERGLRYVQEEELTGLQ
ncbi:acetolactate synthase [Bacteroidales bacterium OttesenSCG-928-A17]|nr:acetolactate synthase [Bacteroidales bacterium OttesenSCG-928-A17]